MKFIADSMLGKLARWLRTLGFDTAYFPHIPDEALIEIAEKEKRLILTRDTALIKRRQVKEFLFIESDFYRDQLRQVIEGLSLRPHIKFLTRCLRCNKTLDELDRSEVSGKVPPYVYKTQASFKSCPRCRRIYWGATHRDRMVEELNECLGEVGKQ